MHLLGEALAGKELGLAVRRKLSFELVWEKLHDVARMYRGMVSGDATSLLRPLNPG